MEPSLKEESTVIRVRDASKVYRVWNSPLGRLMHILSGRDAPTSPEPAVRLTHSLSSKPKRYREFYALRSANLSVRRGECVGLLGYNGAGKSTLLQIIAGTLTPTAGSVEVRGRVAALLELGSGFNPEFTGRENVFLYASILGISRAEMERRFTDVEAFAEIGEFIEEKVRTYSSGMLVRLAFSVLTQIDPDILIVDEALSVGDAYFQHKSIGQIRRFREQGKSILFVSHAPAMVRAMCDRAVILENGVIIHEGEAQGVCDYYNAMIAAKKRDLEIKQTEGEGGSIRTRSGNKRVIISAFEMLDEREAPCRAFALGSHVKLSCALEFREVVHAPTVGFLIRDRLGNSVFGTNTYHLRFEEQTFDRLERAEFVFEIKLDLAPGRYSVTLAAHAADSHTIENYDWVDNLIAFEVIPGGGYQAEGAAYLPVVGHVVRGEVGRYRRYKLGEKIDFGVDGESGRYRVTGWSHPEDDFTWTEEEKAVLAFQIDEVAAKHLELEMHLAAYCAGDKTQQRVEILSDSKTVGSFQCSEEMRSVTVAIPTTAIGADGLLTVELLLSDAMSPSAISDSFDVRKLGVRVYQMCLNYSAE